MADGSARNDGLQDSSIACTPCLDYGTSYGIWPHGSEGGYRRTRRYNSVLSLELWYQTTSQMASCPE